MNNYWWQSIPKEEFGDILPHINQAKYENNPVNKLELIFKALNKTFNVFNTYRSSKGEISGVGKRETKLFVDLLLGMPSDGKWRLCNSDELRILVKLQPKVMNHKTLIRNHYNPELITNSLREKAEQQHSELVAYYTKRDLNQDDVLGATARLLWVIRSNNFHGEKTLTGPDIRKAERDRLVCENTVPLLELIVELLFGYPSNYLAVYGTLAPGQANHIVIEKITGEWLKGDVQGQLEIRDHFVVFLWRTCGELIPVHLFRSDHLAEHWEVIDRFEGSAYRRILIPVRVRDKNIIAYIYEGIVA